jgi:hypothetical protein
LPPEPPHGSCTIHLSLHSAQASPPSAGCSLTRTGSSTPGNWTSTSARPSTPPRRWTLASATPSALTFRSSVSMVFVSVS